MSEKLVKLKAILEERERVFNKVMQDHEHLKRNPPGTPDAYVVAMDVSVQTLFSAMSDLRQGYRAYTAALEEQVKQS